MGWEGQPAREQALPQSVRRSAASRQTRNGPRQLPGKRVPANDFRPSTPETLATCLQRTCQRIQKSPGVRRGGPRSSRADSAGRKAIGSQLQAAFHSLRSPSIHEYPQAQKHPRGQRTRGRASCSVLPSYLRIRCLRFWKRGAKVFREWADTALGKLCPAAGQGAPGAVPPAARGTHSGEARCSRASRRTVYSWGPFEESCRADCGGVPAGRRGASGTVRPTRLRCARRACSRS